jgi:hypothetical protein
MSIPTYDLVWQEGEDGQINLIYKLNDTPVNLTGYKLRMDVRDASGGTLLFTFNSDDIVETPPVDVTGSSDNEAVLGSDGSINILVPRAASLPGGPLATSIGTILNYDIFLRDTTNKQRKILRGTIQLEPSSTKWN